MEKIKCAVVGDGMVGKSSLIITCKTNSFPSIEDAAQTMPFQPFSKNVIVKGTPICMEVWEIHHSHREILSKMCFQGVDVCIFCCSLVNPASWENIKMTWLPEIRYIAPRTPIILVGCKLDLRKDTVDLLQENKSRPVTYRMGAKIAKSIGAAQYCECSALLSIGVNEVFDKAIRAAMSAKAEDGPKCYDFIKMFKKK